MRKFNSEPNFYQKLLWILGAAALVLLVLNFNKVWGFIGSFIGKFMPVIVGIAIAFILNPLVTIYKKGLRKLFRRWTPHSTDTVARNVAVVLALVTVVLFITGVLFIAVPEIGDAFNILKDKVPPMVQDLLDWIYNMALSLGFEIDPITISNVDWTKIANFISSFFKADWMTNISGAVSSVVGVVFNIVIGIVFAINIVIQKNRIFAFLEKVSGLFMKEKTVSNVKGVLDLCSDAFRNFVTGQLTEACILFVLCLIGMTIFRFPYVVATSAIIAITALIPMFGAWIGGAIGALLALTVSPAKMLFFVIFVVCLQLVDNYVVYPRVIGNQMKLPSLLVMSAVVIGGNFIGVVGMIISVPIVSVLYTVILRALKRKSDELELANSKIVTEGPPNSQSGV
jgi:predicted PurR-regulated permease PerM